MKRHLCSFSPPTPYRGKLPGRTDIRRILIIRWGALGDVVMASAAFEDIRRAFPDCTIELNTLPPWDGLFNADPRFQRVWTTDWRVPGRALAALHQWLQELRRARYDLIIDLQNNDRSRILLALARGLGIGARFRLSTRRRLPYNRAPRRPPVGAFAALRAALRVAGIPARTERPTLHFDAGAATRAQTLMQTHGLHAGPFVVLIPGSHASGHLKRWGAARYRLLAERLHADSAAQVVLIGGPLDAAECARIADGAGPWLINLCGLTVIADIVPLCAAARAVIANDTGTAHLAAATVTPLIVICGPTDPRRVKPAAAVALQARLPCINCYGRTCSHHSCMTTLTPQVVLDTLAGRIPDPQHIQFFPSSTTRLLTPTTTPPALKK